MAKAMLAKGFLLMLSLVCCLWISLKFFVDLPDSLEIFCLSDVKSGKLLKFLFTFRINILIKYYAVILIECLYTRPRIFFRFETKYSNAMHFVQCTMKHYLEIQKNVMWKEYIRVNYCSIMLNICIWVSDQLGCTLPTAERGIVQ